MISFWRIFWLEIIALVRSKALALLTFASVAWVLVAPHVLKGDGTVEGGRELLIRYSLGGVFLLLAITLLASATGSIARERVAKRLQLTLTRPVRYVSIALAKMLAYVAAGAFVLAIAFAIVVVRESPSRACSHVLRPVMISPREEAREMYDVFMNDPDTPAAAKRADRQTVLRLLEQRAMDHYQTISTNTTVYWEFGLDKFAERALAVRLRFTNQFDMRQEVRGRFRLGSTHEGAVSNITQAVLVMPLTALASAATAPATNALCRLEFDNFGKTSLMVRPRKDVCLLVAADSFAWNAFRAYLQLVALLALLVAFGVFLSASLGRPVALFVALAVLAMSEMSPSIVETYPDELESNPIDRFGLELTRAAATLTRPVSSLTPLEALSKDECVEWVATARAWALDGLTLPLLFAWLTALVLPRKQDGNA